MILKGFAVLAMTAAAFLAGCAAPETVTLKDVIARHAEARGGVAALDAVRNTLNIATVAEPEFGEIKGRYIASTAPMMRIDVFYGADRVFSEGIDADGEWQWTGDAPTPTPSTEVAISSGALRHGVIFNLYALHALSGLGHKVEMEGRETIDDLSYYKLKITLSDGFETWRYVNPTTWMIDYSRDFRPLHPDIDPTPVWVETKYEDFRQVDGVMSSFRWTTVNRADGALLQTGVIHRLNFNAPADELNFSRTAETIAP